MAEQNRKKLNQLESVLPEGLLAEEFIVCGDVRRTPGSVFSPQRVPRMSDNDNGST